MAVHPRNLVLFIVLAVAAVGTWMLAREPAGPTATRTQREAVPEGYYMTGAVIHGTDEQGHTFYWLYADRVEQEAENDDFVLDGIRVEYAPDANVHWKIAASRGVAPASREFFDLLGDVRLTSAAESGQDTTSIEAGQLRLYPDELRAVSEGQIDFRKGQSDLTATGLELDLDTDDYTLANARIRSTR